MSKLSSSQSVASNKPVLKSKGSAKGLTLDPSKFDSKSTGIGAFLNERNYYSPTNKPDKGSLIPGQTRSPRKNNLVVILPDNLEPKDSIHVSDKAFPQTTKTIRSSLLGQNNEKTRQIPNSNEKVMSTKARDSQTKILLPNYESFLSRKASQAKDSNKETNSNSRLKMMEEPPKKQSVPHNLSLALSNGLMGTGSNSHRAPLNSPHSDFNKLNGTGNVGGKTQVVAQLNRKNSQRSDTETDSQAKNQMSSAKGIPQNHPLNTILADLGSASPKYSTRQGVSRLNIVNVSNSGLMDERIQSPKEDVVVTSPTNELLKLLSEKNKEIHRLANDKMELKSTLESLNGEMTGLKQMKSVLREKEKFIEELQWTLSEAVKESDELKREFERENIIPVVKSQVQGQNNAGGGQVATEKMESIKSLIAQLKQLTEGSDDVTSTTLDLKNSILESLNKKKLNKQNKRENSYDSFYLEKKGDKTPPVDSGHHGHPRNYSIALEDTKKTGGDSPYYASLDRKNDGVMDLRKVRPDSRSKILGTSNVIIKKGDSFLGTPRKIQMPGESQIKVQPHTTTAVGAEIFARKISQDQKLNLGKKQGVVEAGSTFAHTAEKEGGESFDIGKGLTELKNRIARMLGKQKGDHLKLKETHELYLRKLQDLMKE
jgi:hypothetical protein